MGCAYNHVIFWATSHSSAKIARFLLAQLHLDSLAGRTSPKAIRNALKTLPTGSDAYDRAYKGAMERIEGQYNEQGRLARRVISWITCSRRPLTTFELQHALAVEFGTRLLDQENISSIQLMVSVCAGLVTADERSDIIRLIHYTTQEYFERTRNHWFPEAETEITKVCVTYLSFDVFGSESCQTHFALNRLLARNRLFDYAACNWGHHARMSSIEDDELILDLLESGRNLSVCTWAMVSSRYNKGTWWLRKIRPRMAALHATAYFGLRRSTAALLNRGYSPNPEDHLGCTPLYYATDKGYLEVAKILLERGADPNIRCSNSHGPTRITRAMMKGDLELVMSLLSRNSFPNIQEDYIEYDSTPLHHATKNGYLELAELLLEKNADPNVQDDKGYGSTPLHYATRNGNMELVKLLLENNADPNFQDDGLGCGWTPLHYATMNEHLELVKLLLEWNSNPNVQENGIGYGLTPLHYATENGHLELVKLLLEKGANPNILGGSVESGPAPLHYATWNGNIELVELLLEKNADPNLQEDAFGCGSTPLHYATQDGHLELVKLLLEKGADPNIQDHGIGHSLTALHYATSLGHLELVYLLLHNNANPNIQDQHGLSPLHCAARVGNCDMVKLLLDWNADSTVRCHYDLTPLCYATQNGHQKVAGLFGSKGGHHDQANRKRPRLNL